MKKTKWARVRVRWGWAFAVISAGVVGYSALGKEPQVIASEKANFKLELVAESLDHPWSLAKLPDGRLLVTERVGRLRIIDAEGKLLPAVEGTPEVWAKGQGGLLEVALHPDYAENGWIYLSLSDPKGKNSHTKIVRGRIKENQWMDEEVIFSAPEEEYTSGGAHFGCRIAFDKDGYLFFSIGDRGGPTKPENVAQSLQFVAGKVHRIHDDGRIPKDNPFVNSSGAAPTIWSYGNRNPQGLTIHPDTGELWETEHGPRGGDELNIIQKGKNYGWPIVTYGINYSGTSITKQTEAPGMESPVIHWTPSIAVAGMDFYFGKSFPNWNGNLFVTALAHQKVVRLEIDDSKRVTHQEILLEGTGRLRDVRSFDDGSLYLVYDEPGRVERLVPAS